MAASSAAMRRYRSLDSPYLIRRVLNQRGWVQASNGEPWSLFWKNGRFNREELKNVDEAADDYRFNHFPHTDMITQKVFLPILWALMIGRDFCNSS